MKLWRTLSGLPVWQKGLVVVVVVAVPAGILLGPVLFKWFVIRRKKG